jgi:glyoxylase-like metal-dependent hydrolase (beta-lactamase superfamily II)
MGDGADLDYFVWLVRGNGRDILVDTGFNAEEAKARSRKLTLNPVDALASFGVAADTIKDVIVTHLHYDHAGNLDRFPNARFHLQDREMSYATGRCMCNGMLRHPFSVEHVTTMVRHVFGERVTFHAGEGEVVPGVTVHRVGGHSDGLQVVRVETARGPVVLASDAAHNYANLQKRSPFPIVITSATWRRAGKLADSWPAIPTASSPVTIDRQRNLSARQRLGRRLRAAPRTSRSFVNNVAFSSEVDTGSYKENARNKVQKQMPEYKTISFIGLSVMGDRSAAIVKKGGKRVIAFDCREPLAGCRPKARRSQAPLPTSSGKAICCSCACRAPGMFVRCSEDGSQNVRSGQAVVDRHVLG